MIFNPVVYLDNGVYIKLSPPANLTADASSGQVSLKWTDPVDLTGMATWKYTRVVRKQGENPNSAFDGELVVESGTRNQYQSTPYVDTNVTNGVTYYYGAFAFSDKDVPSDGVFASASPIAGTPLSELTEGTLIKINENGSPVEFYLAKHSYEPTLNGQGRELVVRKDCYQAGMWGGDNRWASSNIRSWLNGTYKSVFSEAVRSMMATTTYYTNLGKGSLNVSTRSDSVFSLSLVEITGFSSEGAPAEGSALPTRSVLAVASMNGQARQQWTRSPAPHDDYAYYIAVTGSYTTASTLSDNPCYRPCFTLPNTARVDQYMELVEEEPT